MPQPAKVNDMNDPEDQPSSGHVKPPSSISEHSHHDVGVLTRVKNLLIKPRPATDTLREALEGYIEELDDSSDTPSIAGHEKALISNVLKLRDTTVIDVMIPRADIAAIEVDSTKDALMELLAEKQFSRIPVYRETMDDILGTVHIKDIISIVASAQDLNIKSMIRPVPIVSPSLPVLDLLLKMQSDKRHMVMVVDEYGGIDGLATIGDVIEAIVGEFDDEFDTDIAPQMIENSDGSVTVDARLDIEEFEDSYGDVLSEEEREEVDTIGGLVFYTASRIPSRGEVIKHETGMVFEIIDADQRRVNSIRIRNIPEAQEE